MSLQTRKRGLLGWCRKRSHKTSKKISEIFGRVFSEIYSQFSALGGLDCSQFLPARVLASNRSRDNSRAKSNEIGPDASGRCFFGEAYMGELIMMPSRNSDAEQAIIEENEAQPSAEISSVDFSIWKRAPKERTTAYFPTYSAVSRAMQTAMRAWVREWFAANPEVLLRPHTAYPILVFQCTHPFAGKPTNIFTYDIQQTEALNRAFASAANKLGRELKTIDTKRFPWFTREHYFAYRSKEVVKYVMRNRRAIYKMLNVETVLMDSILKFAII